jgi:hypothetical protein
MKNKRAAPKTGAAHDLFREAPYFFFLAATFFFAGFLAAFLAMLYAPYWTIFWVD